MSELHFKKDSKTFIIAEAGVNHNGSVELARKLVEVAVESGADAVKFQTFKAEKLVTCNAEKAEYQKQKGAVGESYFNMIRNLELNEEAHKKIKSHCKEKDILFLSSAFDLDSIDLLDKLELEIFKIPSGEITNLPYLRKIGGLKKKVMLSTGMSNLGEIEDALDVLTGAGTKLKDITVLHCNTEYPTPIEDVNLQAMKTIGRTFHVKVGYSDHTLGIEVPIAAVALGASAIEKHFTLDKTMPGPDHRASLEPGELKEMVRAIRNIELALGSAVKRPSPSEFKNRRLIRKSVVARIPIAKGELFSEKNLTTKRTSEMGISPMLWDSLIGKSASKDYMADEVVR